MYSSAELISASNNSTAARSTRAVLAFLPCLDDDQWQEEREKEEEKRETDSFP
jgi:hypothetical protein